MKRRPLTIDQAAVKLAMIFDKALREAESKKQQPAAKAA
jgi:hypothetical protein